MTKFYLKDTDTELSKEELTPATLTTNIKYEDTCLSQQYPIRVCYNVIDLGKTNYGFDQQFEDDEIKSYFERMKEFSQTTINDIINNSDYTSHFHRSDIKGNLKKIFKSINVKIVKNNPFIFHFALNPKNKNKADKENKVRNPRIYFMLGTYGVIHILFFDPYHEINP